MNNVKKVLSIILFLAIILSWSTFFSANTYAEYVLVSEETMAKPEGGVAVMPADDPPKDPKPDDNTPRTGDAGNAIFYVSTILLSTVAVVVIVGKKKRNN